MSNGSGSGLPTSGQGGAGGTDFVTAIKGIVSQLSSGNLNWQTFNTAVAAIQTAVAFLSTISATLTTMEATLVRSVSRANGTFTLAAAATTTILQPAVQASSFIELQPTNAAGGTLMGSAASLYISSINPGVSFTVATANASSPSGTQTFMYAVFN
jgi:hypothetical protein